MTDPIAFSADAQYTMFVRNWRAIGRSILMAHIDATQCPWTCDGCDRCGLTR